MAKHVAIRTSAVSPKVSRPALLLLALAALTAFLSGITPDMLAFLGPWAGPTFLALGAVIQFLSGYAIKDPARTGEPPTDAQAG